MSEEKITVDLSRMTFGELEELERMTSGPAARAFLEGDVWPSALVALVYIVKRRDDPKVLLEEIRGLPISIEVEVITGKEDVDPTNAIAGNGSSPAVQPSAVSTGSGLPSFEG